MKKLLVLTDIHLRDTGETIVGLDPFVQLEKAVTHALTNHKDAERLIITGDLAHSGKPSEYSRLSELLASVPIPVSLLIGNHDNRDAFKDMFPDAPLDDHGFVQHVVEIGDDVLIMLDTVDTGKDSLMGHSGFLCEDRLNWLRQQLHAAQGRRVLVFMHHHPHKIGFAGMDMINIRNGTELLDILTSYPNVAHFFAGHVHRTISGTTRGIGFSMFKSTCHQAPFVQFVQDPTLSVDEPAAYGIILLDENSVIAHTDDFEIAQMSTDTATDAMPE